MLLLISFETRRKTQTQSSVQPERLRQQMEVWFYLNEEPRPRGQPTRRRIRKNLYPRSSEARRESFCPLDKDLSWKPGFRTCAKAFSRARVLAVNASARLDLVEFSAGPGLRQGEHDEGERIPVWPEGRSAVPRHYGADNTH